MPEPLDLRVAIGGHELAVWLFAPAGPPRAVLICSHGGSLTRHYWHLEGHPGYSFGADMARRGFAAVAFDQLGMGRSSRPDDLAELTTADVAGTSAALVPAILDRLGVGTGVPLIGVGHSFGGWLTIRQQARHRTFDAVAILGTTLLELRFTEEQNAARRALRPYAERLVEIAGSPEGAERLLAQRLGRASLTEVAYTDEVLRLFHLDDVPAAVVEADAARTCPRRGAVAFAKFVPGAFAADAAAIDVPVLLGYGERDVSPDPWSEPAAFRSSRDVTLHVLERSGHCHNYASTRRRQWDRIAAWIDGLR